MEDHELKASLDCAVRACCCGLLLFVIKGGVGSVLQALGMNTDWFLWESLSPGRACDLFSEVLK